MTPVAKTKSAEIIDKLNDLKIGDAGNYFLLQRFRAAAKAFLNDSPAAAYNVLGAIACLERNVDEMHRYHKYAITLSCNEVDQLCNYSSSLGRLGFVEESYDYSVMAIEAYHSKPTPELLSSLAFRAMLAGRFLEASKIIKNCPMKEQKESEGNLFNYQDFVFSAADHISALGLSDQDFSPAIIAVIKSFQSHGYYGFKCTMKLVRDAEGVFILAEYSFPYDDVDFLTVDHTAKQVLAGMDLKPEVRGMLEIDFADNNPAKPGQVVPLSEDKMALIESLVADVEI